MMQEFHHCSNEIPLVLAQERSRHVLVAGGILVAHVGAVIALASIGPRRPVALDPIPVEIRFVAAPETPPQWKPPEVKAIVPTIVAPMPEVPLVEIPVVAPSERAITIAVATAPAPAPAESGAPKLISSVEYLRQPEPRYPPKSRKLREEGLVVLRVLIDEQGTACSIEVETSSGFTRLDHAAREAVSRAAFRPYVEDGSPRRALVLIPIEFSLNRSTA